MGERLNFICLGDRALAAEEHLPSLKAIATCLGVQTTLSQVLRIDGCSKVDTLQPWDAAASLAAPTFGQDDLLVAYFELAGNPAADRQSVSLETRQRASVVTLSLDPKLVNTETASASAAFANLVRWATERFEAAVLACGPELDLYEVGDEQEMRGIEERLSSDWRCWLSALIRRFPERIK